MEYNQMVGNWSSGASTILSLVDVVSNLPGWTLHHDGQPISMKDNPEETNLGWIVEDDDLIFSIQHRENSCLTTEVIGIADSGSLSVQSVQQIAPELFEVQYLFVPAAPGMVRMNFELNEAGGGNLKQGTITLHVKALYDLTVNLGTGTEGDPDIGGTFVEGEELSYTYSTETCYENLIVTINGAASPADGVIFMDSHQNIVTSASLVQNTVNVESVAGGSTDHDGQTTVNCDGSLTITPSPDPCFMFSSWAGDVTGQDNPLVLNSIMSDLNITPVFTASTIPINGTAANGGAIDIGCATPVPCGASCTIEAVPDPCYEFTGWAGDLTGTTNPATLDGISSAVNISADFALKHYDVTVSSITGGVTDPDGTTSVECGTSLTINATPDPGFRFIGWSGDAAGTLNPLSLTDIQSNRDITANFEPDVYTISVFSTLGGSTDKDGMNTIDSGGSLTIFATPATCHVFAGWSGAVGGMENPLSLTGITRDMDITANFTKLTQIVQVTSTSGGFTDHEGNTIVNCNDDVLITAFPELGYTFLGWSGDATGSGNPLTLAGVVEDLDLTAHFSPPDPLPPALDTHDFLTNLGTITFTGTATSLEVEVSAPTGIISVPVTGNTFSANVPLLPNRKNTVFFTSVSGSQRSAPTATTITHDGAPPVLAIQFPENGSTLTTPSTDVAGSVGDLLSGFQGLSVTVNGISAVVDIGIGTNGSFFAEGVTLNPNSSTLIEATATDSLGNSVTRTMTLFHEEVAAEAPVMGIVSGNGQAGQVQAMLTDPIEVQVTHGDGSPFANKIVTFTVIRSDGLLSPDAQTSGTRSLQIRTDANGNALAFWQMGMDAGCGNNRVKVSSKSIAGTVFFCASADPAPAAQINIGTGNNQRLEVNAPACEPLIAWVNDGCNGVNGIPVTFRAGNGGGLVNGLRQVTVTTGETGHAQVNYTMGPSAGTQNIVADFPGNPGAPVVFMAFGVERDISLPTTFSGLVIDNAGRPIGGATCSLTVNGITIPTTNTNADGVFSFSGVPDGPGELIVDGKVATALNGSPIPNGSFPGLHFPVVVVPNAENSLPTPVKLPRMNPTNEVAFDNTTDVTLSVEEIDGLEMRVKAGSMRLADGSIPSQSTPVMLSLNSVHVEDIPMPMPDGAAPPFAWTLQPGGATFDPPIEISYPNMSGLAPGALAFFLSFNHDTNNFEIVSTATVTEDGGTIETDEGMGLSVAGWGGICPPYAVTGGVCYGSPSNCVDEGELTGGTVSVSNENPVCGEVITFSVSGVTDTGGMQERGCPGVENSVMIPPGQIQYSYELLPPSGPVIVGSGDSVSVLAAEVGDYVCRFSAEAVRSCPPGFAVVGEATSTVQQTCVDCLVKIGFEGDHPLEFGSTQTFIAYGGPFPGNTTWAAPGGIPSSGTGNLFSTHFVSSGIQSITATWNHEGIVSCSDSIDLDVNNLNVQLTAHRQYTAPFRTRPVPDTQEEIPGVGIRFNTDDDDGNGLEDRYDSNLLSPNREDDLILLKIDTSTNKPIPGIEFVLRKENNNIKLWDSPQKMDEIVFEDREVAVQLNGRSLQVYAECVVYGETRLDFFARRISDQYTIAQDTVVIKPYASSIIVLGGEDLWTTDDWTPADPPLNQGNQGIYNLAILLYSQGFDVYMFNEDEVDNMGDGAAFLEISNAAERMQNNVALLGYSHGGGSVHDLAENLNNNLSDITVVFTAYIDAIDNESDVNQDPEFRMPPSTQYHVNIYQRNCEETFPDLCGNSIQGACLFCDFACNIECDINVNTTTWGSLLNHTDIDDHPNVIEIIKQAIFRRVVR